MDEGTFENFMDMIDSMPEPPPAFVAEMDQKMKSAEDDIKQFLNLVLDPCDDPDCDDPKECVRAAIAGVSMRLMVEGPAVSIIYTKALLTALVRERYGPDAV
jgi:hypothetical protein